METEVEAKFLRIDHNAVRAKLKKLGARCEQPMRLMKRKNYDFPDSRLEKGRSWVRVRDEGDRLTLSYKQLNHRSLHGTKEVSLEINDFTAADSFLQAIGLVVVSFQETRRESWLLENVQIELDEWPWIRPFLEVEGPNESAVRTAIDHLRLNLDNALYGSVEVAYQAEYDVSESEIDHWQEITFKPIPQWLEAKRRKG
ncbi:MAG TPA: CYTH domain-containing protein [Candidatus Saccharimonadales bacterium]|nr:CYTH domain-containing protein [Candidatus Saccharimonadales bacterium]